MNVAVMGAGAVGCYYGGMLARAGHDVVLIGRPQHVEAVQRQGLRLETQTFDEHVRVSASTEGSAVQGAQLVLFCVKSTDTESGAATIKPAKLITNCAYNALPAITQLPYGRLVKGEGVTVVLRDLVAECVAVAKADGVTLPGDVKAAVDKIAETAAGQYSSTAQDLARGKRSEIDHLNGFIVRRGEAQGVATPANRMLHAIVKLIESK